MSGIYQITGSMAVANTERYLDPRHNGYSDVFGAMMTSNLMDFRLLKGGIAELSYYGPAHRSHLTPEKFVKALEAFMSAKGIAELAFDGEFLFIQTDLTKEPQITKITVEKGTVSFHEAAITWAVAA
jgi:hypothetical protein